MKGESERDKMPLHPWKAMRHHAYATCGSSIVWTGPVLLPSRCASHHAELFYDSGWMSVLSLEPGTRPIPIPLARRGAGVNPISKAADIIRFLTIQGSVSGSALQTVAFDFGYLGVFAMICSVLGIFVSNRGLRME